MKAVIQRVQQAQVHINNIVHGHIDKGLLVLLGIHHLDTTADADWLCHKIVSMRIFNDDNGLMNKDVMAVHGNILLISQFTLYAETKKGNRPSFIQAAAPTYAIPLYEYCIKKLNSLMPVPVPTGVFGADMQVSLVNDGPVTIVVDTLTKI
jgi:D-aminoacyl-tRNA deacylase